VLRAWIGYSWLGFWCHQVARVLEKLSDYQLHNQTPVPWNYLIAVPFICYK